jgi:mannose-6-phosphate isomerase-like protein (cupin superfamily)
MNTSENGWKMKQLSTDPDDIATDGAEIRWVFEAEEASVVHCTLPPNAVSVAICLIGIHEIWYFIEGQGRIRFRQQEDKAKPKEREVSPGTCLTISAGTHLQYRNTTSDPLTFLCITMPPFQSNEANSVEVEPLWEQE